MYSLIDTSEEFLIAPFNDGIQLVKPTQYNYQNLLSVGKILKNDFNIGFCDKNSNIQKINETAMIRCGYPKCYIGKSVRVAAKQSTADLIIENDLEVINTQKMKMYEFNFERLDNINYHAFSLKFPWYGNNNQIVGIFICGISIVENNFSELIKFLTQIKDMNLLSSNTHSFFHQTMISSNIIDGVYIPKREMECLMYLTQGNTAKMTAQKLKISPRTVEYYIDNIKVKLNVHSKNELLNKLREFYTK